MVVVPSQDLVVAPDRPEVRESVVQATWLMRQNDFAGAAVLLQEAVTAASDSFAALAVLGELYLRTGRCSEAKELFNRALMQRPPNWEAYQGLNQLARLAEVEASGSFTRRSGVPPPRFLRSAGTLLQRGVVRLLGRNRAHWPDRSALPQVASHDTHQALEVG